MPNTARAPELDTAVKRGLFLIGVRWMPPLGGARLPMEGPSTGEEVGRLLRGTAEDIDAAVDAAHAVHPGVRHPWFTGSVEVGRKVQAAAAPDVVPVALELGGKLPQIFFADADFAAALPFLVGAGIENARQTGSTAARILIRRDVHDRVAEAMADRCSALRVGPALDVPDVGPLISAGQRTRIDACLARGAGLSVLAGDGFSDVPSGGRSGGADAPPRRAAGASAGAGRDLQPRPGVDPVRDRGGRGGNRQHALRPRRLGPDAGDRATDAAGEADPVGAGPRHPRRGGRGRASVRRNEVFRPRTREGVEALYGFATLKTVAAHHG